MPTAFPRWLVELEEALPVCGQILLSGNIRDTYLIPAAGEEKPCALIMSIWECLTLQGFEFILVYDPVRRLYLYTPYSEPREEDWTALDKLALREINGLVLADSDESRARGDVSPTCSEEELADVIRKVVYAPETQCAIIIDFASRIIPDISRLDAGMIRFFVTVQKLSLSATQRRTRLFNPVLWAVDNERDLPDWFVVGNDRVRTISVPLPDIDARRRKADRLAEKFPNPSANAPPLGEAEREKLIDQFARLTDRLKMTSMASIADLADAKGLSIRNVAEIIRRYKVGVPDNPWTESERIEDIGRSEEKLKEKIHGQDHAIRRVSNILMRSVVGLTGAHSSGNPARPRGVLFFAGPTGVGKTMLAKAITKLVFGDEQAYIRFDMSEFSAEHSEARLIGAPPGYTGYDAGGQLVNAIRQRPFSVILFDEIEKAHPRILDKFLQILEDGRLTDGRGETVFFSESIIVFTSNLGMSNLGMSEKLVNSVDTESLTGSPESPPTCHSMRLPSFGVLEEEVRAGIDHHFRHELERPELLNRIGDNIVVFDFIRPDVASKIFNDMLNNIWLAVKEQHGVDVDFSRIEKDLHQICTLSLDMGARGIGNQLETALINPLSRALFFSEAIRGGTSLIRVKSLFHDGKAYCLEIDESSA